MIENPILNSPYREPSRHFLFGPDGITGQVTEGRRESTFFIPIAPPKKRGAQLLLEPIMTADRMRPNELINRIRTEVELWRKGGYRGITPVSRRLLEHWTDPERDRKLFFCQVEAAETAIFLGEVATKHGVAWIENELRRVNDDYNGALYRIAIKIATGGGKTLVMAMLIAWQVLNKQANRTDARFSERFLVVTPGITVRDRLRVLKPADPDNYYEAMDLVPPDLLSGLGQATIELTNYHAFIRRETIEASKTTKQILANGGPANQFQETPEEMVNRVCRVFGSKKSGIVVMNDEAHHCHRRRPEPEEDEPALTGDDKKEAEREAQTAAVWISGLEAIRDKLGVKVVYDLSATPFFLRGSGYIEGTLFPWVVSDFALIDAIEAGIVKVPRVPVADDRATGDLPTYRNLWINVREKLPKGTRGAVDGSAEPKLPGDLEGALQMLYEDYERSCKDWENAGIETPPVFIVVANNTRVSKLIFDHIAGWEKTLPTGDKVRVPGRLPRFTNVVDGDWSARPQTLLVDSVELESGEMSKEFKAIASREIEEFKHDYRLRSSGKDPETITEEELLREVLNTVGKPGKLGADVRCVVSVSMLAEGWDATTVTHILGVRAFGTQLLCEQVVGRALRRYSYVPDDDGMFPAEYAEVYGVPFSFIPTAAPRSQRPKVLVAPNHVATVPERNTLEISYPRVAGYRYDIPVDRLDADFTPACRMTLTTKDVVMRVECDPIVGQPDIHTLEELRGIRLQAVAFGLARRLLENHFRDEEDHPKVWLFPQLVGICQRWLDECLTCSSETYPQLLLLAEHSTRAAERIHQGIVQASGVAAVIKPVLSETHPIGTTAGVEFDTLKPVVDVTKSHLNRMVLDSDWEAKVGQALDAMAEVEAWVKNDRIGPDRKGLRVPYVHDGKQVDYIPDFIVRLRDDKGDILTLLIEVTGERREAKLTKAGTALNLWVPAVNNWGRLGRWDYLEIHDPWMAGDEIRSKIRGAAVVMTGA